MTEEWTRDLQCSGGEGEEGLGHMCIMAGLETRGSQRSSPLASAHAEAALLNISQKLGLCDMTTPVFVGAEVARHKPGGGQEADQLEEGADLSGECREAA